MIVWLKAEANKISHIDYTIKNIYAKLLSHFKAKCYIEVINIKVNNKQIILRVIFCSQ